jgi:hypothetical protein
MLTHDYFSLSVLKTGFGIFLKPYYGSESALTIFRDMRQLKRPFLAKFKARGCYLLFKLNMGKTHSSTSPS